METAWLSLTRSQSLGTSLLLHLIGYKLVTKRSRFQRREHHQRSTLMRGTAKDFQTCKTSTVQELLVLILSHKI